MFSFSVRLTVTSLTSIIKYMSRDNQRERTRLYARSQNSIGKENTIRKERKLQGDGQAGTENKTESVIPDISVRTDADIVIIVCIVTLVTVQHRICPYGLQTSNHMCADYCLQDGVCSRSFSFSAFEEKVVLYSVSCPYRFVSLSSHGNA